MVGVIAVLGALTGGVASASAYQVTLSGPSAVLNNTPADITATSSQDLSSTPYYIEIYDVYLASNDQTIYHLEAICGWGATCHAYPTHANTTRSYVAFIGNAPGPCRTPPYYCPGPQAIQAKSNVLSVNWWPGKP